MQFRMNLKYFKEIYLYIYLTYEGFNYFVNYKPFFIKKDKKL